MYQLKSSIPGVQVFLTQNPLNARIVVSDSAKREIALMLALSHLFDETYNAFFHIKPPQNANDEQYYSIEKTQKTLNSIVDSWFDEDVENNSEAYACSVDRWLKDDHINMMISMISSEHGGDCTADASGCPRCYMENFLGVCTLPSGKYINRLLRSMWFDEYASPEQKAQKLKREEEFRLKYPSTSKLNLNEVTKVKWSKEEASAIATYSEHKRLYALQESQSCDIIKDITPNKVS